MPTSDTRPDSMRGNQNAAKPGRGTLIAVRFPNEEAHRLVIEALDPTDRGRALAAAAEAVWEAAMTIVADCDRCGEAITATEGVTVADGEQLCLSCAALAALVKEIKNAPGGAATPPGA